MRDAAPRGRRRAWVAGSLACALLGWASAAAVAPAAEPQRSGESAPERGSAPGADVADLGVRFGVRNVNRSGLPCPTSGAAATIVGRLIGPSDALSGERPAAAVTLYLHEFTFGKWLWSFPDPAYDYAALQAADGHVSVVVDRIGYGESSRPGGYETCLGADADIAHQIVNRLRAGTYELDGGAGPRFERVVLAGHSGGGMSAQIAAYSFGGIDGLILFSHADQGFSGYGIDQGLRQGLRCATGGQPSEPGGPGGYAYFGETPAEWHRKFFDSSADPAIAERAVELRHRDPCGNVGSFPTGALVNVSRAGEITVPVLLLFARHDSLYDNPSAGRNQRGLLRGSDDTTVAFFDGGHALPLQRSAPELRATVSEWLAERDLGGAGP